MAEEVALNLSKFRRIPFVGTDRALSREAALELETLFVRVSGALGPIAASDVKVIPSGGISSINVQAALQELDAEKLSTSDATTALAGKQPLDATLTALAALSTLADQLIYATGADAFAMTTLTAFARTLLDDIDAAAMRATLGLGTAATSNAGAFQPADAELTALAGLVSAADRLPYFTGLGTAALATFTAFARTLLDDPDAATARATLGAGTVTSVSVASANGFGGSVATATSTPAITLTTSLTGLLKGNGTAMSAAVAGTDYLAPPAGTALLKANSGGALANAVAGTDYVAPGGALGTPSSGTLTNCTGLPISTGVSGLAANVAAFLASPSSANMAAMITDETGTGANVFATSPTLVTPNIGAATGTSLAVTGALTSSGTAGVGYATGAGGTVTQLTSKGAAVTLNTLCGEITMNNAALAAGTTVGFNFLCSVMGAKDVIEIQVIGGVTNFMSYRVLGVCGAGGATINVKNDTAGSLSEAVVLRFAIIKAVTA